jgi:hypothetical protein
MLRYTKYFESSRKARASVMAEWISVLCVQSIGNLLCVAASSSGIGLYSNALGQRRTFDVLHDEAIGTDVVQSANVGTVQCRNGPRLALEAIGELPRRNFDSDIAPELRIARSPDFAHAAFAAARRFRRGRVLRRVAGPRRWIDLSYHLRKIFELPATISASRCTNTM